MKVKTSITLSPEVLAAIDRLAGRDGTRSAAIERIVRDFIKTRQHAVREARDVALLNTHSSYLNGEAADTLQYQAWPGEVPGGEGAEAPVARARPSHARSKRRGA